MRSKRTRTTNHNFCYNFRRFRSFNVGHNVFTSEFYSFFVSSQSKIVFFLKSFLFALSGEALTKRLRARIFRHLLRQEVSFFDRPENNTGALCTRLATEASDVQGVRKLFKIELFSTFSLRQREFESEQRYRISLI